MRSCRRARPSLRPRSVLPANCKRFSVGTAARRSAWSSRNRSPPSSSGSSRNVRWATCERPSRGTAGWNASGLGRSNPPPPRTERPAPGKRCANSSCVSPCPAPVAEQSVASAAECVASAMDSKKACPPPVECSHYSLGGITPMGPCVPPQRTCGPSTTVGFSRPTREPSTRIGHRASVLPGNSSLK